MRLSKQWHDWLRGASQMVVATICVVVVLLVTANKPDADEFTRGIPSGMMGAFGAWMAGKMFQK